MHHIRATAEICGIFHAKFVLLNHRTATRAVRNIQIIGDAPEPVTLENLHAAFAKPAKQRRIKPRFLHQTLSPFIRQDNALRTIVRKLAQNVGDEIVIDLFPREKVRQGNLFHKLSPPLFSEICCSIGKMISNAAPRPGRLQH